MAVDGVGPDISDRVPFLLIKPLPDTLGVHLEGKI